MIRSRPLIGWPTNLYRSYYLHRSRTICLPYAGCKKNLIQNTSLGMLPSCLTSHTDAKTGFFFWQFLVVSVKFTPLYQKDPPLGWKLKNVRKLIMRAQKKRLDALNATKRTYLEVL